MDEKELIYSLRERIIAMETKLEALAPRGWVTEVISPIRDSVLATQHTVEKLSEDIKALFAAHDALLKERAEQERRLYEEKLKALEEEREAAKQNTIFHLIKERWVPLVSLIIALGTLLGLFGSALAYWIQHSIMGG